MAALAISTLDFLAPLLATGVFVMVLNFVSLMIYFYVLGLTVGERNLTFWKWIMFEVAIVFIALLFSGVPFISYIAFAVGIGLIFPNKASLGDIIKALIVFIFYF